MPPIVQPAGVVSAIEKISTVFLINWRPRSCKHARSFSASVMVFHGSYSPIDLFYVALPYMEASLVWTGSRCSLPGKINGAVIVS
jgi:hypothetical protein